MKFPKILVLAVFLIIFVFTFASAQKKNSADLITPLTFPVSYGTSALEDMSSGTTQLIGAGVDDAASGVVNIGFTFYYDGAAYNQFSVNSNGLMRLGPNAVSPESRNDFNSGTDNPKIVPYWDDICPGSTGKVHYKLVGVAPNRKLVVEWKNMHVPKTQFQCFQSAGGATFQAWLDEKGRIDFVYGAGMVDNALLGGYSIGLTQATGVTNNSGFVSIIRNNSPTEPFITHYSINYNFNSYNIPDTTKISFIQANSFGLFSLPSASSFVTEGLNYTATVNRAGAAIGAVSVNYTLTDGTATGGAACSGATDYINTGGTLNFAAGETSKTIQIPVCADAVSDQNETFTLMLSNPTGGAELGTFPSQLITIQEPLIVTKTADTNDGVCDADCSLREAVATAQPGNSIFFSTLFNTPQTITLGSAIVIDKDLTIYGTGANLLTLSGGNVTRIFVVINGAQGNPNVVLNDLTMTAARLVQNPSEANGAAILNIRATLTLNNAVVSNSTLETVFDVSNPIRGGAIYNDDFGTLNINNSKIIFNTVTDYTGGNGSDRFCGGGIFNRGVLNINNSTVGDNFASSEGGGIYLPAGTATIINSSIIRNRTSPSSLISFVGGGGIRQIGGVLIVKNSTISSNYSRSVGGIFGGTGGHTSVSATFINSTIANNSGRENINGAFYLDGTLTLRNTIIANNEGSDLCGFRACSGVISFGNNLVVNPGGSTGFTPNDIIGQNPLLAPLANNGGGSETHAIAINSPARNAGSNTVLSAPDNLTTDQRGVQRRYDTAVDIGAFELTYVFNADNAGAGSLRDVVNLNPSNSEIYFDNSFFAVPRTINLTSGEIVINKNLTMHAPTGLTIDANLSSRIFNILPGATFNLSHVTLKRGKPPGIAAGGAVLNFGTFNLLFSNVTASEATTGGGLANGQTMNIMNSAIYGNTASDSGGISNGGNNGTTTIVNSTISGNTATFGGGGGLNNYNGTLDLTNVTVAFNTTVNEGGGILSQTAAGASVRLRNTLIANNTATLRGSDIANSFDSQGYNIIRVLNPGDGGGFGATDIVGTSANPVNVGLRPLAFNGGGTLNHSLQSTSAAINAADLNNVLATDQRNVSRPRGGRADIGAVEATTNVLNADTNGADSLRFVLEAAADGDTITFDPTFFNTPRLINLAGTGEIAITKAVTIQGPGANLLTISGGNLSRVFGIAPGLSGVTLSRMTIANGGNVQNGGGIFTSSRLNLNNVVLTGNSASSTGGAIYNSYQTVNLNNTTVSNNTSIDGGGGIYSENFGSGAPSTTSILNIRNSTFSGNSSNFGGGGIWNNGGTTRLSNSTFSGNSATSASAINNPGSQPLRIVNSTITANTDSPGYAAVVGSNSNVIDNSIVAANSAFDLSFGFSVGSNNLIGNGDLAGFINGVNGNIVGTGMSPVNPMLGALANNGGATQTHALLSNSLAKNAGNNSLAVDPENGQPLTTDQRGVNRIVEGLTAQFVPLVDIGAFEIQAPTAATAMIRGRLLVSNRRGLTNAQVILTNTRTGEVRYTRSSAFGYFTYENLPTGDFYILEVNSKRYQFNSQSFTLIEDLTDLVLTANQ